MNFVLDTVSLDSFFHNLLLGIPRLLTNKRRNYLARFPAASTAQISAWETKNVLQLPIDLKNFYASTNGFHFKWFCSYGVHKLRVQGRIEINALENLTRLQGLKTKVLPGMYAQDNRFKLRLGRQSKVFELSSLDNGGKITLVYLDASFEPTIWLLCPDLNFYYLAENFTTYFRMAIGHVGFPSWQMLYAPGGIPEWTRILMRLIAPRLLTRSNGVEEMRKTRGEKQMKRYDAAPVNVLNPKVFDRASVKSPKSDRSHAGAALSPRRKRYHWVKSRYMKAKNIK